MIIAAELGAPLRITSGPAIQHAGDLAAILSSAQRGRGALPRRDPPDGPAGRGDALPRDGGLPGRRRRRQGPGRDRDPAGDPAVHPGRRHHPRRAAARPAARPVRLHRPPGLLRRRRARAACCARSAGLLDVRARRRTARAEIAGRSRGTPRIANRLLRRVRDFAQVRADGVVDRARSRGRARASTRSTSSGSTGSTAACSTRCAAASAAARSGCPPSRSPSGEERETVEEVAEPFLVRAGLLARTPRGRVATPAAWTHLGPDAAPAPAGRTSAPDCSPASTTAGRRRLSRAAPRGAASRVGRSCPGPAATPPIRPDLSGAPVGRILTRGHPAAVLSLLLVAFYLLIIRPAAQPRRELQRSCRPAWRPGAEVMTTAGLYGTVDRGRATTRSSWRSRPA